MLGHFCHASGLSSNAAHVLGLSAAPGHVEWGDAGTSGLEVGSVRTPDPAGELPRLLPLPHLIPHWHVHPQTGSSHHRK